MKIEHITVSNFKSFKDLEFDFKNINIILGPNNSGKSNILRLLLLLKQTFTSNLQSPLILNGNIFNLGSFKDITYRFLGGPLKIKILLSELYKSDFYISFDAVFDEFIKDAKLRIEFEYSFNLETKKIIIQSLRMDNPKKKMKYLDFDINTNEIIIRNTSFNNIISNFNSILTRILDILNSLPSFEFTSPKVLFKGISTIAKKSNLELKYPNIVPIIDSFIAYFSKLISNEKKITIDFNSKFPTINFAFNSFSREFSHFQDFIRYIYNQTRRKNLRKYLNNENIDIIENVIGDLYGTYRRLKDFENYLDNIIGTFENLKDNIDLNFNQLYYIGPLRNFPERYYSVIGETAEDVGFKGEFTPYLIKESIEKESLKKIFHNINSWLNKFEMAKSTNIKQYEEIQEFLSIIFEEYFSGVNVNLTDMGVGTSQILPIIIEGFFIKENSVLLIEQPEIHLHPKAQATLGDLFIEIAAENKILVIETHSEYLIQRIQRRIAEGIITNEDVAFYYVEMSEEGSKIQNLIINEDGYIENIPDGFFDEDYKEAYKHIKTVLKKKISKNKLQ